MDITHNKNTKVRLECDLGIENDYSVVDVEKALLSMFGVIKAKVEQVTIKPPTLKKWRWAVSNYFLRTVRRYQNAEISSSGYQEVIVRVKDGYYPNKIVVCQGRPIRIYFIREDHSSCSEMVMFPDFQKTMMLPIERTVFLDLFPNKIGVFSFTCQMGIYHGKLIVKEKYEG